MKPEVKEDMLAFFHGRAFVYELGHTVFGGEPDERLFEVLGSDAFVETAERLAVQAEGLNDLADYLAGLGDEEARAAELGRASSDYQRVVLGLGASSAAHPWESYYTNNKQLLFQVETLEVRIAYREFGYLPELYPRVADDHIALECAFMAELARKTIEVLNPNVVEESEVDSRICAMELVDGQLRFVNGHLAKWVGRFAADAEADGPGGLYAVVAAALAGFLPFDEQALESARRNPAL